jgi:hypothetical protein
MSYLSFIRKKKSRGDPPGFAPGQGCQMQSNAVKQRQMQPNAVKTLWQCNHLKALINIS